ncbi:MAG: hypothetical protein ACPG4Z_04805, partial [Chitinophagales bacterium]
MIKVFNQKPHLLGWLCFAIAIIAYANTFTHDYVWDDALVMTENAYTTQGISGIDDIWTKRVFLHNRSVYRPIPQTIFALEYAFFSDNPSVSHIVNVLFYAFTCLLLFYFLRQLFPNASVWLLFFIALLYTLHPLHTEVVANIKSLDEILAMFFGLISAISVIKMIKTQKLWKWSFIFIVSFAAAILSKVSAITLLPVFLLIAYYQSDFDSITAFIYTPIKWMFNKLIAIWKQTFSATYFDLSPFTLLISFLLIVGLAYGTISFSTPLVTCCIILFLFLQIKINNYYFRIFIAFLILATAYIMGWTPFLYLYFLTIALFLFQKKDLFFFLFALAFAYCNVKLNSTIASKVLSIIPILIASFYTEKRKWILWSLPIYFLVKFFLNGFQIEPSLFFAAIFSVLIFFKKTDLKWRITGGIALILSTLLFVNIKINYNAIAAKTNHNLYQGGSPNLTPAHNEDWTVGISILNNSLLDASPSEKYATITKIQGIYLQKL